MGLDNLPKLGLSQTVKEKEINIQDMDLFNRGSLSNLRNRLLSDDASERRYMFDDCIDMIGQVVSANVEQFKNHHNNKQNTFHKENREIQRLLYLEGNESDIESILKLTFWTNKMAKTYNEVLSSEKEILGQEELVYFERGETWSYALKNEFMSTLIYLLIKDNYSEVKSWGFRKGKNPILIIDYPGYNFPISFHLGKYPENILPRELGELVFDKTKDDFKYPFDIKPKGNSVSHKLNEQEKTDYQRDFDNEQTFKSLEKIQKHQILVGLGKISELETLYSIKLPLEGSLNIELDKNFLTIKDFEFRKKLEEMIIKKKGVIYIQKGNRLSKHAIEYSLNNWWKENYSDRSDLEFRETRPGEIFPGEINIDNTKKSGEPFQIREDGTICIDSIRDRRMGTRSSIQNLARLGFYFPQQIIDYANNPKFSEMMIDPNYLVI